MDLSQTELERYSRQMLIAGWGIEGQRKLKASKVAVVGIGGLGCLSSLYLAAAGVGRIILIDRDKTSLSDLNRQVLYSHKDLGHFKADVARKKLQVLNSEIVVEALIQEVTEANIPGILGDADLVLDGLDNWSTRFMVNDHCVRRGIPFIHAGVSEFYGQLITIAPGRGPCLRCIFPKEPAEVGVVPVFAATPAVLASLQVMEVVKLVTRIGEPLVGRMLFLDGEAMMFETAEVKRNAGCPVCATVSER